MKRHMSKLIIGLLAIASIALIAPNVYTAVSGETLINVQNPAVSTTILAPNRVKDAGNLDDNITKGMLAVGPLVYDGTNWDKVRGDTANGIDVDVTRISGTVTMTGNITPADAFTNPATAINGNTLLSGFNGTTWDRLRSEGSNADGDAVLTLGVLATEAYNKVFNGTTWDRIRSGITIGSVLVDNTSNTSGNITTDTTTAIKATAGILNRVIVNMAGTAPASVALYNIASAGCTGTPASGYVATLSTETAGVALEFNHTFTLGICAVTVSGATDANVSALYR